MINFSGIQPTGKLQLGNYLGAIQNWIKLQGPNSIYCVVDLHSITNKLGKDSLSFDTNTLSDTRSMIRTLVACGIDPQQSTLFVQSSVKEHAELQWLFSCIAPQAWLNKMTQYKDKKSDHSTLGLFTYPVLMAADIVLYQATHVPVGEDQKQHVELTRDYVQRFNQLFKETLIMPNYVESQTPRVMSLRDAKKKMSKSDLSDYSRINLDDEQDLIHDKIKKAKTDSIPEIKYTYERPEIANLIRIYSALGGVSIPDIEIKYQNSNIVIFKEDLAKIINNTLAPIQQRKNKIKESDIDQIIEEGQQKASRIAKINIARIKKAIGLLY